MHLHSHGGGSNSHHQLQEEEAEEVEPQGAQAADGAHGVQGEHQKDHGHSHGHSHKKNINVRAAFIHVIGDLIQSIGVLIAAGIIKAKVSSNWWHMEVSSTLIHRSFTWAPKFLCFLFLRIEHTC